MLCAPSEDSDQTGHPPSLIRVFVVRWMGSKGPKLSSCGQQRLWSDWADAQADLSLRWAHMLFCWFCHEAALIWNSRKASSKEPHPWSYWAAAHARLKDLKPHDSKVPFLLRRLIYPFSLRIRDHRIDPLRWAFQMRVFIFKNEPQHDKTDKTTCAPIEDSDQPGHQHSLVSLRCPDEETLGLWLSIERTAKIDQTGRSLRWVHMTFCWFWHAAARYCSGAVFLV